MFKKHFLVPISLANGAYNAKTAPSIVNKFLKYNNVKTVFVIPTIPYEYTLRALNKDESDAVLEGNRMANLFNRYIPANCWNARVFNFSSDYKFDWSFLEAIKDVKEMLQEDKSLSRDCNLFVATALKRISRQESVSEEQIKLGVEGTVRNIVFCIYSPLLFDMDPQSSVDSHPVRVVYSNPLPEFQSLMERIAKKRNVAYPELLKLNDIV